MVEDRFWLRLSDVLAEPSLRLRPIVGTEDDPVVRGAHPVEAPDPTRWLEPGWLMLTTGTGLADGPDPTARQRRLVGELQDFGAAALGFATGVVWEEVPEPLLEEAASRGFPVFGVPAEVPFLHVVDYVNRRTLAADLYRLKSVVGIQNDLLEALTARAPEKALIHRLAALLHGAVVLYGQDGGIIASEGGGPTRLIEASCASAPPVGAGSPWGAGRWSPNRSSWAPSRTGWRSPPATTGGATSSTRPRSRRPAGSCT